MRQGLQGYTEKYVSDAVTIDTLGFVGCGVDVNTAVVIPWYYHSLVQGE